MWILGGGERQGAHPLESAFVAVSDSHLGCLMTLLLEHSLPLQCDIVAGFARLQGSVLWEMGESF